MNPGNRVVCCAPCRLMNRPLDYIPVSFLCLPLVAVTMGWSQCKPGDPVGRFEGSATSSQAGKLDISLTLLCVDGHYAGTLDTPVGMYTLIGGTSKADGLRLQFAQDGVAGVAVEAKTIGNGPQGTFTSGDETGPLELQRTGEAVPLTAREGSLPLTPQQWRDDLAFFTRELPKRHPDAFAYTSKDKFDAAATELDGKIDHLNSDQVYIGLDHLANLIGDAHTYLEFPDDNANLPLDVRQFGAETRVVAVAPGYEQALESRVAAIAGMPIAQARELALTITPVAETDSLRESRIDGFLTTGMALHGLGITPDRSSAMYTLIADDGKQSIVTFKALASNAEPKWVRSVAQLPLSEQRVNGSAACTYLSAARTLYCNVRQIRDLAAPSREMFDILKRERPDKLVIDLRHNNAGDYNVGLKYLIEPLRKDNKINQRGHLFVLISAVTFSAAMSNAAQFRAMTNAMLVGQPIGERPNSYQEPRQFKLPNSHLVVRYSTRYYKFVEGRGNVVAPDKEITPTWEDYKSGHDVVLDWVLAFKDSQHNGG
jgi:Peptidase family S41